VTLSANCRIGIGNVVVRQNETIVLIDELRASSTVVTACALGVEEILPVLDDAMAMELQHHGVVIAGEQGCLKIEGYDIGNSPVELTRRFAQTPFSKLALKTTNFIPLLLKLPHAIICSSLNLAAVARAVKNRSLCIIAAGGTYGVAEDCGVALGLAAAVSGATFEPEAVIACISESAAAHNLREKGLGYDVDFIARLNVYEVVPYYDGKVIRKSCPVQSQSSFWR